MTSHQALAFSRRGFLVLTLGAGLSACATTYEFKGEISPAQLTVASMTSRINEVRRSRGSKAVTYNARLAVAARTQANRMAERNKISHDLGSTLRERVTAAGYEGAVGENLAAGHKSLESAINGWLESPGHRNTLLTDKFTEFGLAVASSGNRNYWALVMGGSFKAWNS